jgi:hypothetical protein
LTAYLLKCCDFLCSVYTVTAFAQPDPHPTRRHFSAMNMEFPRKAQGRSIVVKHDTLGSSKIHSPRKPPLAPRREHAIPSAAQRHPLHSEQALNPDTCRKCGNPKQRGQPCGACSKRGSEQSAELQKETWSQRFAKIQLGLVDELEGKTGKKYQDLRGKLRGTPWDVEKVAATIQEEIRMTQKTNVVNRSRNTGGPANKGSG